MTTNASTTSGERTEQTTSVRLGAWQYGTAPSFDFYRAPIGRGWLNYEQRWHEPPAVEISIPEGVSYQQAAELLNQLVARLYGLLEAEAEWSARKASEERRFANLTEDLQRMPPERLQLVESLIKHLAGHSSDESGTEFLPLAGK